MKSDLSKGNDLFNAIKNGHLWEAEVIKGELEKLIVNSTLGFSNHDMRWDVEDKYHYIYDNECYLFVFDKKIQLRCDRENVFSSHQTVNYEINSIEDIKEAYERFCSMTMEDEDES